MDKKEKFIELYKDGFPSDADMFVKCFFDHAYNPDNAFINASSTSAAQIIYKRLSYHGKELRLPFFVAVSTVRSRRGSGEVAELIREVMQKLKGEKLAFVGLYPFRHDYYTKYGFVTIDKALKIKIRHDFCTIKQLLTKELLDKNISEYYRLYTDFCELFDIYLLRSKDELKDKMKLMLATPTIMTHYLLDNRLVAFELYSDGEIEELGGYANVIEVLPYSDNVQCRILDIKSAFELADFCCQDCSMRLNVTDYMLGDSCWSIDIFGGKSRATRLDTADNCCVITISQLSLLLLGGECKNLPELAGIFSKCKVYIGDKY